MAEPQTPSPRFSPPCMGRGRKASWLLLLPNVAGAADTASPVSGYIGVVVSLFLILGGFVLVAWLVRRWMPHGAQAGLVKVVGAISVGPRERVVVVEVDNTWLVLGVGGGQVRSLHTMNKPQGGGQPG
ncbi:MAG: flagellar biosynthetic protein FliO [Thiobacillaceae bacterium]